MGSKERLLSSISLVEMVSELIDRSGPLEGGKLACEALKAAAEHHLGGTYLEMVHRDVEVRNEPLPHIVFKIRKPAKRRAPACDLFSERLIDPLGFALILGHTAAKGGCWLERFPLNKGQKDYLSPRIGTSKSYLQRLIVDANTATDADLFVDYHDLRRASLRLKPSNKNGEKPARATAIAASMTDAEELGGLEAATRLHRALERLYAVLDAHYPLGNSAFAEAAE